MLLIALMAASAAQVAATDNQDNVVRCVRESVTGSLSTSRRVCHTVGEWKKIRSDANDEVRRNMQPGTMNDKNN